jgi:hypothetical protein
VSARPGRVEVTRRSDGVEATCRQFGGGRFAAQWVPASDPAPATEGSLAEWLLERRRFVGEEASPADDGTGVVAETSNGRPGASRTRRAR